MTEFLLAVSGFVLAMTVVGLVRLLLGPQPADRLMSAQLFGTGGIACLLLISVASQTLAIVDVALTLALLAGFVTIAFVKGAPDRTEGLDQETTES